MAVTVFEGYTVGPIERGIPMRATTVKPLSAEQALLLQLKVGEFLDVALYEDGLSRLEVSRLLAWARRKNIGVSQRDLKPDLIRIERIADLADTHSPG